MSVNIVLGLNYGDEGKGRIVEQLPTLFDLNKESLLNVRFSGGQQCGHTVHLEDGRNHVFSNFGCNTFDDVATFFTEHTSIYPPTAVTEYNILKEKDANPILFVHPYAKLTTPYDVAFNRAKSMEARNSCGLGIGATQERHNTTMFKTYAMDLFYNYNTLTQKLLNIKEYYRNKAQSLSIYSIYAVLLSEIEPDFYDSLDEYKSFTKLETYQSLTSYEEYIFEGSQGIGLDMDFGVFPDVTYASTTMKNAFDTISKMQLGTESLYVNYVTRAYLTRHGDGFFENGNLNLKNNEKETNVNNPNQGEFKIGYLNYDLLNYNLFANNSLCHYEVSVDNNNLFVTCVDQTDEKFNEDKITTMNFNNIYQSDSISGPLEEM